MNRLMREGVGKNSNANQFVGRFHYSHTCITIRAHYKAIGW